MKISKLKSIFCFFVLVSIIVSFKSLAQASELKISSNTTNLFAGDEFKAELKLDTQNERINAIEGKLTFDQKNLKFKQIESGNSIISLWIQNPKLGTTNSNGLSEIDFSGITPGGYQGTAGTVFTVIFETKEKSSGDLNLIDTQVLLNDGKGSKSKLTISPYSYSILDSTNNPKSEDKIDSLPPEEFNVEIKKIPLIAKDKYFAIFDTSDKDSGIDYFEGLESLSENISNESKWSKISSPFELKDQQLKSYIFIRAFDRAGNYRTVKVNPQNNSVKDNSVLILVTFGVGIFTILISAIALWLRKQKKN